MNTQSYKKYDKVIIPPYTTFKGGYGSWNDDMSQWDYFCLWSHLRFCYNKTDLIDGWTHISLYGYRNGYTYTPVKKLLWDFNWHFAFNKKFPFIQIRFKNIWKLKKENFNSPLAFNKKPPVIKIKFKKFGN